MYVESYAILSIYVEFEDELKKVYFEVQNKKGEILFIRIHRRCNGREGKIYERNIKGEY